MGAECAWHRPGGAAAVSDAAPKSQQEGGRCSQPFIPHASFVRQCGAQRAAQVRGAMHASSMQACSPPCPCAAAPPNRGTLDVVQCRVAGGLQRGDGVSAPASFALERCSESIKRDRVAGDRWSKEWTEWRCSAFSPTCKPLGHAWGSPLRSSRALAVNKERRETQRNAKRNAGCKLKGAGAGRRHRRRLPASRRRSPCPNRLIIPFSSSPCSSTPLLHHVYHIGRDGDQVCAQEVLRREGQDERQGPRRRRRGGRNGGDESLDIAHEDGAWWRGRREGYTGKQGASSGAEARGPRQCVVAGAGRVKAK